MITEYREFNIGDQVRVVDRPYAACPFAWVSSMNSFCSREVTITEKHYVGERHTYKYRIDADCGMFGWCGNCFEPLSEFEIEAVSDDELLELLM